jgi:hypothetical protein
MGRKLSYQLLACGKKGMPETITYNQHQYKLEKVMKHDFFAATGLYLSNGSTEGAIPPGPAKLVLKLGCKQHFLFLPLSWFGKFLRNHEVSISGHLSDIPQVPKVLCLYDKTGFLYEYIEGSSLDEQQNLPEDFFDNLKDLLQQIHEKDIVYLDMNKNGNIIHGNDGKPYLIDFQISLRLKGRLPGFRHLVSFIKKELIKADIYHIYKHKRRFCPELLRPEETPLSYPTNPLIKMHRLIANPFRKIRRAVLNYLRET